MNIAEREQQILRVKASSFQPELDEALVQALQSVLLGAVKTTLEAALNEEVKAELAKMGKERPRRSGYFQRGLDTQYGHLSIESPNCSSINGNCLNPKPCKFFNKIYN